MTRKCCIVMCNKRQQNFPFPVEETMKFKWSVAIGRYMSSVIPWQYRSSRSRVCIDHFVPADFVQPIICEW